MTDQRARPPFFRSQSSSSSVIPRKNKPRLYVTLYPRGGSTTSFVNDLNCDSFHWALTIAPQTAKRGSPGTRYHIAHSHHPSNPSSHAFVYEEQDIPTSSQAQIALIRIVVAKVTDCTAAEVLLRTVPVDEGADATFNCLTWTKRAFLALVDPSSNCTKSHHLSASDWPQIEECARKYVKRKREQRRFTDPEGPWDFDCVSTFNYWDSREVVP